MRSVDERAVADGGDGHRALPMLAADRGGFIDRHQLWTDAQYAAAGQLRRVVDELGIELIRFSFADQHGVLRGKTLTRAAAGAALRSGVTVPSSLLLKDPSGASVFPVFAADPQVGVPGFAGAGDLVLVPDPTTFRVLPWAERTGWVLCDLRLPDGSPVPLCTRSLLRGQLDRLAAAGYAMTVGVELEFHVFAADPDQPGSGRLGADQVGRPGAPGRPSVVRPVSRGAQLLHEDGLDRADDLVQLLHHGLTRLDLPLRSLELEFGPSQFEITLTAGDAADAADQVLLARSAIRQLCRRHGYHATFMSRPAGAETASTGWHLHQSLRAVDSGAAAFDPTAPGEALSPVAGHYLAGLLEHAGAAAAFATPTVNGYKRYLPFSLAPDRVVWGIDNKGAMVRAVGAGSDTGVRLENRCGEPAANPYLYVASQLISGLDGIERRLAPPPAVEDPYAADAPRLPASLAEALTALAADPAFAAALGDPVVSWYLTLKRREFARYLAYVSDWEQREYFDLI
ncbi:glutamine synthetase family protein [Solwaraspora sp. WMMD791]|uniref:glutamine synthetase family protein n=1 Tax=Solwaraspora sp. WMMD791 TaxID=3016086 RepID=UPI00249B273D|nr:glutamine synthetase family protein [Solwaraspora sp. WMMD791]WFE29981.1 glutamine synthetase family protein [Solwaraspora sp. WMMD791]